MTGPISGFSLRGIGTNVFSINIEPSVAIVVDDVPLVRSSQAFSDLLDIERIEVLRGPQSTLFGKNASAGVVNVITRDPGEEFGIRVRAGYTTDDDFQAQQARIVNNLVELGIANVGELKTYGVEVDFQAALTENFRVVGGLAYINAEVKEFPGADCWVGQTAGCVEILDSAGMGTGRSAQDLGGESLNNSPDFKFTVRAEYLLPLENLPFTGFVNVSYQWQDDVNFSLLADPGAVQKAYGIADLSVGIIESDTERYTVTLFVNNLFDEDYVTSIVNFGGLWGNRPTYIQTFPRDAERYAGIQLGIRF